MSTLRAAPVEQGPPVVATPGRGTTRIADRAVARIAARAARDALVPHTRPGHHPHAPRARITTGSGAVRVALQVRLPYPADLAAICTRLQDDVALRLGELTGLQVREITVDIEQCNVESTTATPTPAVDLTKPPPHPGTGGTALVGGDGSATADTSRLPHRWWAARRIPSALTAGLVLAGSLLLIYKVVAAGRDHPTGWVGAAFAQGLADRPLGDAWVIVVAAVCVALGLWMIMAALMPGGRRTLPLRPPEEDPALRAGLGRAAAATALRDAALSVAGVTAVRVRVRRRITVRAITGFGDPQRIETELTQVLNQARDGLGLAHPPALTAHTRRPS